jgi:Ca-activated chloride channel family protein
MVAESAPRPAPSPAASAPPPPPAERKAEASEGANKRRSRDDRELAVHEAPPADWGAAIYLSNDDSMSLSSAQRVIWAIDRYEPIPRAHVRPHELLNYFSFQTAPVPHERDFSVVANIEPKPSEAGIYSLALAVQGRPLTTDTRRNVNLSYVIDRSGSMADEGRMDYLKRGLLRSLAELKHGDIVHLVLFDSSACTLAQNFVVGRDSHQRLADLIRQIEPRGATNVHEGLSQGYAVADAAYQPAYTNRVVLVTDALTNTGVTDQGLISMVGRNYDARRIRLSGVGVGSEFNDSLLDELTERGRGAYVFLGSEAEVDAVFGSRFVSLIETVANDVHFRLHLPPSLAMNVFYGEEASTQKERVQAIHYFANTSQLFLSDLKTRYGGLSTQDDIMLTIEYEDPETLTKQVEEYAFNLGTILGESRNVRKAQLVNRFVRAVGSMAERPMPAQYAYRPAAWYDDGAWSECAVVRNELASLAQGQQDDPEVLRVQGLWDRFCGRYATPAEPPPPVHRPLPPRPLPHVPPPVRSNDYPPPPLQRNNDYAPPDSWPSAQR